MPDQARDVLQRVPLELSRDTKVWRISRGTQSVPRPAAWGDLPELAERVVTIKGRADSRGEDQVVILPERPSQQPFCGLAVEMLFRRITSAGPNDPSESHCQLNLWYVLALGGSTSIAPPRAKPVM